MAGCALLWSLAGIFIKLVDWHPFAIACGRSVVAAIFLWAWVRKPRFTFSATQLATAGLYAATMLLFVYANKNTSSANAILLQYGAPVYVALFGALFLGEKTRAEHWGALALMAAGMGLFFRDGLGGGNLAGDMVAILSGFTLAGEVIVIRKLKDGTGVDSLLLGHIMAALVAGAISLFMPPPEFTAKAVGAVVALGVLQIGLANVLFAYGMARVSAVQGILVATLEPIFNPIWVFVFAGEKPAAAALAGGGLIVAAVVGSSVISVRRAAVAAGRAAGRAAP